MVYYFAVYDPSLTPHAPILRSGYCTNSNAIAAQAQPPATAVIETSQQYDTATFQVNTAATPPVVIPI